MDYSSLSREELITLLRKKEDPLKQITPSLPPSPPQQVISTQNAIVDNSLYGKCKFISTKGPHVPCTKLAVNSLGFCTTHKNTLQARTMAQKQADEEKRKEEEKLREEEEKKRAEYRPQPPIRRFERRTEHYSDKHDKKSTKHKSKENKPEEEEEYSMIIKKNQFKNFEHPETHIVFNPINKKACGVQRKSGVVTPLRDKHIEICLEYGWKYELQSEESDSEDEKKTKEKKDVIDEESEGEEE
jgi:hypothetical protein